jgi:hypothetical protein
MNMQASRSGNLGEAFQANRWPIALIGIGVAWLLAGSTGLTDRVAHDQRVQAARRRLAAITNGGTRPQSGAGQIVGPSGEPAIRVGEADRAEGWIHQAAGAARGAISSVRDAGSAVLDRAGSITGYAGDAGRRAGGQLAEKIERDPWLTGVVGFVAGALLAAALPPTQTEQELLAGARAELRNKATEFGHEAAERLRELADSTPRASRH